MCGNVLEKAKDRCGTVNRTSDYAETAVPAGSINRVLQEI